MAPIHPALLADMRAKQVDVERTLAVVELANAQERNAGGAVQPQASSPPPLADSGDPRVLDREGLNVYRMDAAEARSRMEEIGLGSELLARARTEGTEAVFPRALLQEIGIRLYPKLGFGVLNGGSATSYTDHVRNRALDGSAYAAMETEFNALAAVARNAPKGIAPAYIARNGEAGPSFLELKFRSLLIEALRFRRLSGDANSAILPFFQMTSPATDGPLAAAYTRMRGSSLLGPLIDATGVDPTNALSAIQPMLAALTHRSEPGPRRIFDKAWGAEHACLPLPGGHGENFRVLSPVYRELRARGVRWAYLGNVDNIGYTVDPVALALTALSGAGASFEFSWRTSLDVKGGVLLRREDGGLAAADIGQVISLSEIDQQQARGIRPLFNCGTGIFDLDYLVPRLERIADTLPLRISEQEKSAGHYAQAEQTTWEVLGLIEKPLILAVSRQRRFLPAKMLLETLLTSPASERLEGRKDIPMATQEASRALRAGLDALLPGQFGIAPEGNGSGRPLSRGELEAAIDPS